MKQPSRSTAVSERKVFQPIKGTRAFEEVVDQITFAIRAGVYRVGDRLPTIDELARDMATSRPTIGDAVERLSEHGVLDVKRGATGGLVVASNDIPLVLMKPAGWRQAAVKELIEARRAIEMQLALLAGERADEDDIARMRDAVQQIEQEAKRPRRQRAQHLDHVFHYAMGRAAHSDVLFYFQHLVMEQLRLQFRDFYDRQWQDEPDWVLRTHRGTLAAIESRDRNQIIAAMNDHFTGIENEVARRRS
jgi:GntR family transcriptional repressor for pyruvate dehydrogenase complex